VLAWSGSRQGQLFGFPLHCIDLSNPTEVRQRFRQANPQVILHAAAVARIADCQRDPERALAVNAKAAGILAEEAGRTGARLIQVSTDLVFDGEHAPYREEATPHPLSVYGQTKAEAEKAVLAHPGTLVVRVSLLFGPSLNGQPSFFEQQAAALQGGQPVTLFADEWRAPLALTTAARALLELAQHPVTGILHLGGPERMSRLEMGLRLAGYLKLPADRIVAALRPATGEPRPRDTALDSSQWRSLFPGHPWPSFEEALREMLLVVTGGPPVLKNDKQAGHL
jgi:dTDP-4-dehydrorhamnose reductase